VSSRPKQAYKNIRMKENDKFHYNESEMEELAKQLSKPDGENGILTGERMNLSNGNMILRTIDLLQVSEGQNILEVGPGNGAHVQDLCSKANNLHYFGIDISQTMIREAQKRNPQPHIHFQLSDGITVPFTDHYFDRVFSVNTLYFWEDPIGYAKELYRVLKPGGKLCLAFAPKAFMQHLPFTSYGFRLYETEEAGQLLEQAGFIVTGVSEETDQTRSVTGDVVERPIVIMSAGK
jgi:ubiquinone/menaquinone biosynthesis C-methylase UbiE